jgi:hypothetical protein
MSHVFSRGTGTLPTAVRAEGAWIELADGRRLLDAAAGAIVSAVGHGRPEVAAAAEEALRRLTYVHAAALTSQDLESYAAEVAGVVPLDGARVFPVSGGSEAMETALKLARAYHLARGEPERTVVLARDRSYHGNTLGALDLSGREPLRRPYLPWLGRFSHLPAVYEYRCPNPGHPDRCGDWHAARLDEAILRAGPGRVAAFVAEPIGGATTGAALPPGRYWPGVAEVCRRHGVLVVVDEVMTGFGRTGRWFGIDHFGVRPDILVAAKGAASGYWPLGLTVASGEVHDTVAASGFVHGFTFSHHPAGAAVGRAVLGVIRREGLVEAAAAKGPRLLDGLRGGLSSHPHVGDVRGRGLLVGIEVVADRDSKRPFPRSARVVERVRRAGLEAGILLYSSTGCADGTDGDVVLIGPPLTVTPGEIDEIVARTAQALAVV